MLSGYKTYIDVTDTLNWLLGGGALAALRAGIAK